MADDEALLFGGMTLARLTNIRALFHRVDVQGRSRISAPYFYRPSPRVFIPASPGHSAELVQDFNARTRAAHDDELTSTGAIIVLRCDEQDYERRLSCEKRYVDRRKRNRDLRRGQPYIHRTPCTDRSVKVVKCSSRGGGREGDARDNELCSHRM